MRFGAPRDRQLGPVLAVLLGLGGAACSPTELTTSPNPTPAASASLPVATASAPAPSASSAADSPPSLPAGVTVDPGLLEVLPGQVDGATLEPDPATATQIASDLVLAESALSIAVALAVAPGTSGSEDLAVASVTRLRPDAFDEAFYQEWRDTYNAAACEVADGVLSEVKTMIGARTAYVGTCVGGALTYHTYLEDQGFIVSITATGPRRFGELIIAGLR